MSDLLFSLILLASSLTTGLAIFLILLLLIKRFYKIILLKGLQIKTELLVGPLFFLIPPFFVTPVLAFLRLPDDIQAVLTHIIGLWRPILSG